MGRLTGGIRIATDAASRKSSRHCERQAANASDLAGIGRSHDLTGNDPGKVRLGPWMPCRRCSRPAPGSLAGCRCRCAAVGSRPRAGTRRPPWTVRVPPLRRPLALAWPETSYRSLPIPRGRSMRWRNLAEFHAAGARVRNIDPSAVLIPRPLPLRAINSVENAVDGAVADH